MPCFFVGKKRSTMLWFPFTSNHSCFVSVFFWWVTRRFGIEVSESQSPESILFPWSLLQEGILRFYVSLIRYISVSSDRWKHHRELKNLQISTNYPLEAWKACFSQTSILDNADVNLHLHFPDSQRPCTGRWAECSLAQDNWTGEDPKVS